MARKFTSRFPPACARASPSWAADGKRFAFVNIASDSVELWIGDAKTGDVHQVPGAHLNPMFDDEMQWMPDQKTLLVKLVPKGMGAPPPEPIVPIGPSIQETDGEKGQSSTYETRDTLSNKHDEDLFDYYAASQLAFVDAATVSDHAHRKAGELRIARSRAGRTAHPRHHDPQALLLRHHLRSLPERSRSLGRLQTARTFLFTPSPRFRWPIAFPSTAFRQVRAIFPGAPPSPRRSSGPKRSTAATGTSRSPLATR